MSENSSICSSVLSIDRHIVCSSTPPPQTRMESKCLRLILRLQHQFYMLSTKWMKDLGNESARCRNEYALWNFVSCTWNGSLGGMRAAQVPHRLLLAATHRLALVHHLQAHY